MIDLTPLTNWLSSLGPWGMVLALVVGIVLPRLIAAVKAKLPPAPSPAKPATPADPALPAPASTGRPVLDALLNGLRAVLGVQFPGRSPDDLLHQQLAASIGHYSKPRPAVSAPASAPAGVPDDPPAVPAAVPVKA